MNGYFKDFVDGFLSGEITNKVLYSEIKEFAEHEFFIQLYHYLRDRELLENSEDSNVDRLFTSISLSYHTSSRYFEGH